LLVLARKRWCGHAAQRHCDLAELTMAVVRTGAPELIEKNIDLLAKAIQPGAGGQLAGNPT
jgi:hypothetical protein